MQTLRRNINPFALMIDPQAIIAQIEGSERLERLHRRVCRPLDKPLLGNAAEAGDDAVEALNESAQDDNIDSDANVADSDVGQQQAEALRSAD